MGDLKSAVILLIRQKSIGSWLNISTEILYTIIAKWAAKLPEVKIGKGIVSPLKVPPFYVVIIR